MKADRFARYGLMWGAGNSDLDIEIYMIQHGGRWRRKTGGMAGNGLEFHYKALMSLLWPSVVWHKWNTLILKEYFEHRTIVVIGSASSGKSHTAAMCVLADYFCFPSSTTILCCSTTLEALENRVWGEIKSLFRAAKHLWPTLPGNLIESRKRIVTDENSSGDGRDFRNGLMAVPCKRGGEFAGISDFIGIKNKRLRLLGDELAILPKLFVDAVSNLDKNTDFKFIGLGNPKDTTDALGVMAEPAAHLGGWEGGIDQKPGTKTWETRRQNGICIQLPGTDSPNLDGKLGIPLITQEQIDRDISFYGKDSLWFTMMDEGKMPRGQGSRRVLTRQLCMKHRALEAPVWLNSARTKVAGLDAAYRGVGGDRCVFVEIEFGVEATSPDPAAIIANVVNQSTPSRNQRQIMALTDVQLVPINVNLAAIRITDSEDQIVQWVMNECKNRGIPPNHFFFDAGMRTSLVSSFARLWSPDVVPIDFGGAPTERPVSSQLDKKCSEYYSKFVTELWYSIRLIIEAEQFRGLTEEVMAEGCMREYGMVAGNKIEVESKKEMKKKTGRSPDLMDALVTAVEGARRLGFQIANFAQKPAKKDDAWRTNLRDQAKRIWKAPLTYA